MVRYKANISKSTLRIAERWIIVPQFEKMNTYIKGTWSLLNTQYNNESANRNLHKNGNYITDKQHLCHDIFLNLIGHVLRIYLDFGVPTVSSFLRCRNKTLFLRPVDDEVKTTILFCKHN